MIKYDKIKNTLQSKTKNNNTRNHSMITVINHKIIK